MRFTPQSLFSRVRRDLRWEVFEEPTNGLLGITSNRESRPRVIRTPDHDARDIEILHELLHAALVDWIIFIPRRIQWTPLAAW